MAKTAIRTKVLMIGQHPSQWCLPLQREHSVKETGLVTHAGILWFWTLQRTDLLGFSDHTSGAKSNSSWEAGTHEEKTLLAPAVKWSFDSYPTSIVKSRSVHCPPGIGDKTHQKNVQQSREEWSL